MLANTVFHSARSCGWRISGRIDPSVLSAGSALPAASSLPHRGLSLAIASALALSLQATIAGPVRAEVFPARLDLAGLDGSNGFAIDGEAFDDGLGFSFGGPSDINGDGFDDLVVAAHVADPNGTNSGRVYVLFGPFSGRSDAVQLSSLDGSNGFVLNGELEYDLAGQSLAVGDINADGFDDILIGLFGGDRGSTVPNRSYLVFGAASGFPAELELADLDGSNGIALDMPGALSILGYSVSAGGDVNGDGIDDLIIGDPMSSPNGVASGRTYVVFGSSAGLPHPLELSNLNGSDGFVIAGESSGDGAGNAVSVVGDINGDGIDEIVIGASRASTNGNSSGRSYVVFGRSSPVRPVLELSELDGVRGFAIDGEASGAHAGRALSAAGDINGDGLNDIIIGAPYAEVGGSATGRAYVVFGTQGGFPALLELASLDGGNGSMLDGEAHYDRFGISARRAGDINGDGVDDLVIGADWAGTNGAFSGSSYVVFGTRSGFPAQLQMSALDGRNGFVLDGEAADDVSGRGLAAAGDLNGDGVDDLVVGARGANADDSGRAYVVFGSDLIFVAGFEEE
jgi:hypothetical protein